MAATWSGGAHATSAFVACLVVACSKPPDSHPSPIATAANENVPTLADSAGSSSPAPPRTPAASVSTELTAHDGVTVYGTLYKTASVPFRGTVLLFHQAGSNAQEYASIGPGLSERGFDALAIDQRSGGERWGRQNQTVTKLGGSQSYADAYADLEAALKWADGRSPVFVWGSSYSAALVFRLAAEHPDEVSGVLAFSPGEYLNGAPNTVRGWAAKVEQPLFVTSASSEKEVVAARLLVEAAASDDKTQHLASVGVHGSSTLRSDENQSGADENWQAVGAFLDRVAPPPP